MEKQEMVMSVASENRRGWDSSRTLSWGLLSSVICPPFLHQRELGSPDSHPSKGCLLATPRLMSPELGWLHPEVWPLCPNDAHLLPRYRSYHFQSLTPTHRAQVWGGGPGGLKGKPC